MIKIIIIIIINIIIIIICTNLAGPVNSHSLVCYKTRFAVNIKIKNKQNGHFPWNNRLIGDQPILDAYHSHHVHCTELLGLQDAHLD